MVNISDIKIAFAFALDMETCLFAIVQNINLEKLQSLDVHGVELELSAVNRSGKIADHKAKIVNCRVHSRDLLINI
jgi:hypothetical protein